MTPNRYIKDFNTPSQARAYMSIMSCVLQRVIKHLLTKFS